MPRIMVIATMAKIAEILKMTPAERDAVNAAQLSKLTNIDVPQAAYHDATRKAWQAKICGPLPTAEQFKMQYVIDASRQAGYEVNFIAMSLRSNGVTVGEYMCAAYSATGQRPGGAAHNNAKKVNDQKGGPAWFVRVPLASDGRAQRWQHVITDKGIVQLDKRIAQLSAAQQTAPAKVKPAKAKTTKPRKAKAAKAAAPVVTVTPADNAAPAPVAAPVEAAALTDLAAHFNS
jgi:hypothetical protein